MYKARQCTLQSDQIAAVTERSHTGQLIEFRIYPNLCLCSPQSCPISQKIHKETTNFAFYLSALTGALDV